MANNGAGNQADVTSKSTASFTSALVINAAIMAGEIAAFAVIFKRFRKIYEPRSYLVPHDKRPDENLPRGLWRWIPTVLKANGDQIIRKNGLDAYQYVRFLWLMTEIFVPFWIISWIVLFPVDAVNSGGDLEGINIFTFGNIGLSTTQQTRYSAHLILLYFFTFYVFWLCDKELRAFVTARHEFLSSREHAELPQSKTVLITGVPRDLLSHGAIEQFFRFLPGGINRVWLSRDLGKEMPDLFERRQKAALKLEAANTKLAKKAIKLRNKAQKAQKKGKKGATGPLEVDAESSNLVGEQLVPRNKRPTHKLGFLGLIGKKVDSIDWAKDEYTNTNNQLQELRNKLDEFKANGSVFVRFNSQISAHMFQQCLAHHLPMRMSGRFIEVAPEDVIWSNLSINPYQQKARKAISWALTIGLIIAWTPLTAFVTSISNLNSLCAQASWLAWVCNLPGVVNGIIQGILPPAVLALLFMLVPIIYRLFATYEGIPLRTMVERSLMVRYFVFLVIQGFLVSTLASGLIAAIPQITQDPSSAVTLLATELPKASTFFLTFIVTTQLSGAAGALLQIATLVLYYVFLFLLGSTPRKVYNIKFKMQNVSWGTTFPNTTLLTVICIVYSIIAPLINGFAAVGFFLTWFTYKYLFIYVYDMPASSETGGLFFPTAIQHIFVALYIEELCMTGLFFLARDVNDGVSALPEAILSVILIVITIGVHYLVNSGSYPLINNLPLSLAGKIEAKQAEANGVNGQNGHSGEMQPKDSYSTGPTARVSSDGHTELGEMKKAPTDATNGEKAEGRQMSRGMTLGSRFEGLRGADAFNEPPAYQPAPIVWLAEDQFGIARSEVGDLNGRGIEASTQAAKMNEKGKVDVERSPPDEDWVQPRQ